MSGSGQVKPPPRQSPWANGQIATGKIDGKGEIPRERVGTERNWVQDPPPRSPKRVVLVADYGGEGSETYNRPRPGPTLFSRLGAVRQKTLASPPRLCER